MDTQLTSKLSTIETQSRNTGTIIKLPRQNVASGVLEEPGVLEVTEHSRQDPYHRQNPSEPGVEPSKSHAAFFYTTKNVGDTVTFDWEAIPSDQPKGVGHYAKNLT